ncbi:MAG: methyltransferase domain-containing protein [Zoogloeaceae bacterium]|nr:methyltransferase domain-containing protein [Zoogloeaceae bacterium]
MTATEINCRLCRQPLAKTDAVLIGPFPKAAQYYPQPSEFTDDKGIVLQVVECPDCGLTQLLNEPVDYYKQVITAASLSPVVCEQRLTLFRQLRASFSRQPAAIEIGCASGENLPLLREAGFVASGIEYALSPDPGIVPEGVTNRYILDLAPETHGKYDLLISFNYLEHQPDTRSFLKKCHALLSDNGQMLLTVPNLDFLLASQSAHEFVADHLVYFTADSLTAALNLTGFSLNDIRIINNQYDIQVIATKRKRGAIASSKSALETLVTRFNEKLRALTSQGKKVAVWGAGHRTLALLSLSEYQLLECIIDSAKFKHYQFAPISHLRILPPETLLDSQCGIDVILVMVPGIYPKEVIKKIQSLPVHYDAEQFPPEG